MAYAIERESRSGARYVGIYRQRVGHGSLEVTSRYAAILDERDTSLADALEEIFDDSRPVDGGHKGTTELTAVPRAV